jgi:uncharacterized protein (TIGR02246 family)
MKGLLVLAVVLYASLAAPAQASPDETAVRNIIQEEITAWNSGDAVAYSRHFAAEGTFTNIRGQFFTGRQPFIERHDYLFKGPFHGSTLRQDIVSLKFVRPDVAVVEVLTSVTGIPKLFPGTNTDDKGRLRTRLLQVVVKKGGEWKIAAIERFIELFGDAPIGIGNVQGSPPEILMVADLSSDGSKACQPT